MGAGVTDARRLGWSGRMIVNVWAGWCERHGYVVHRFATGFRAERDTERAAARRAGWRIEHGRRYIAVDLAWRPRTWRDLLPYVSISRSHDE